MMIFLVSDLNFKTYLVIEDGHQKAKVLKNFLTCILTTINYGVTHTIKTEEMFEAII